MTQVRLFLGLLAAFVVALAWRFGRDNPLHGALIGVLGLVVWVALARMSLRRGRHAPWATAQERLAAGDAVVLWKPGCVYCERLLHRLADTPGVTWVNVWADKEANAAVRAVNDGNEYTPTVLIGDQVLRNPTGEEVLAALDRG